MSEFRLDSPESILARRSLDAEGKVQQYIDSAVLRLSSEYIPLSSGALLRSGVASNGSVSWNVPYAQNQYYMGQSKGQRGRLWFERMKADHLSEIVKGAAEIAGGKA